MRSTKPFVSWFFRHALQIPTVCAECLYAVYILCFLCGSVHEKYLKLSNVLFILTLLLLLIQPPPPHVCHPLLILSLLSIISFLCVFVDEKSAFCQPHSFLFSFLTLPHILMFSNLSSSVSCHFHTS
jgi:hypothetical protein